MAEQLYALTAADVGVLKDLIAAFRRGELGRPLQSSRRVLPARGSVMFGMADTAIEATSGTNPGSGTLNVYRMTTGGTTDTGRDETVRNLSSVARTTGEFTVCVRDDESGQWLAASGFLGYKPVCRFVLDSALATSDPTATASLTHSYGQGTAHTTGDIIVTNLETNTTLVYVFYGSSGAVGYALYNGTTEWPILQMEC